MTNHLTGFSAGQLTGGSCFSSPLMIYIAPDAEPSNEDDPMRHNVQGILRENLRDEPGKAPNPFYTDFLALVEQPTRSPSAPGYPTIGMHAMPAINDARDRGPRQTDAAPPLELLTDTVTIALVVEERNTNQLDRDAVFDIGNIYSRAGVHAPRLPSQAQLLATSREGIQSRNQRVSAYDLLGCLLSI
jgi:hypothetical protein